MNIRYKNLFSPSGFKNQLHFFKPIKIFAILFFSLSQQSIDGHDIPKERIDRTIQLTFEPGLLRLEYGIELDDTTIAADFRRLKPGLLSPDPEENYPAIFRGRHAHRRK